jgi:hypothetical protein
LIALILIMGFLDLRRNESNLVGFMEDQALSTISVLQRLTEGHKACRNSQSAHLGTAGKTG